MKNECVVSDCMQASKPSTVRTHRCSNRCISRHLIKNCNDDCLIFRCITGQRLVLYLNNFVFLCFINCITILHCTILRNVFLLFLKLFFWNYTVTLMMNFLSDTSRTFVSGAATQVFLSRAASGQVGHIAITAVATVTLQQILNRHVLYTAQH